ncbi:hypothetical protein Cgig2_034128 [Carnegiea gigantea]|uniref:Uncharacterized protein n=1 Tax=Carnegiea gigantea TaxID=171969 RepID=A0A9Q1QHD5_9CARY|nr:hypothetical protein Cgig2_034128 [Carnegiea gigantea]
MELGFILFLRNAAMEEGEKMVWRLRKIGVFLHILIAGLRSHLSISRSLSHVHLSLSHAAEQTRVVYAVTIPPTRPPNGAGVTIGRSLCLVFGLISCLALSRLLASQVRRRCRYSLGLFTLTVFYLASVCGVVFLYKLYVLSSWCTLNIFFYQLDSNFASGYDAYIIIFKGIELQP